MNKRHYQSSDYKVALDEKRADLVRGALFETGGRRGKAAELLGIPRETLWELIKRLDITDIPPTRIGRYDVG